MARTKRQPRPAGPGVYVGGKRVKGICVEESSWGIGTYQVGEGTLKMYGVPPRDLPPMRFRPDFECCTPAQLETWFEAFLDQLHDAMNEMVETVRRI